MSGGPSGELTAEIRYGSKLQCLHTSITLMTSAIIRIYAESHETEYLHSEGSTDFSIMIQVSVRQQLCRVMLKCEL